MLRQPAGARDIVDFEYQSHNEGSARRGTLQKRYNGILLVVLGVFAAIILSVLANSLGTSNTLGTPTVNIAFAGVIGLVLIVVGAPIAMRDYNYSRNVIPDALARRGGSWRCQRCGTIFVV